MLASRELDALVLHGVGRPGMITEESPMEMKFFRDIEVQEIQGFHGLEKEFHRPVLIGAHYSPWESQAVRDVNEQGIRTYNRLSDIACLLDRMAAYQRWKQDIR